MSALFIIKKEMTKKLLLAFWCVVSSQILMAKTVGPLIQTQWNQSAPFNLMIQEKDGQHCLASCGAAAMAQLCYYYRWPEHGTGEGIYYLDDMVGRVDLSSDYYDYDKMLLTYDDNSSEEAIKAVALLVRDVAYHGVGLNLYESYSPPLQEYAMNFGYDKGMMHLNRSHCSQEEFEAIIRSELDAGRPVYINGSNGSAGHAFLCDGYNDEGEYHFNYGWGGLSDGWSTLENCLFPVSMQLDFNIKKDEGGKPGFTLSSNRDFKWMGGNLLYGNYKYHSHVPWGMKPQIALAVENTATHEVQYYCHYDVQSTDPEEIEQVWDLDADLNDGSYVLYPVVRDAEYNSEWKKGYFRDLCQREVELTVKDGAKTFVNATLIDPVQDGAIEIAGLCYKLNDDATATVTSRNNKYASYAGDIVMPDKITVDGKDYAITGIEKYAFKECHYLGNLTIAKNVKTIEWGAFDHCAANKITFEEGSQLKTIGEYAFYCDEINEIILPEGLETIENSAFGNAHIGSVTIPSTVKKWGAACFQTISLKCVHINSVTPPAIEQCFRENAAGKDFPDIFELGWSAYGTPATVLYVPAGTKAAYAQADVWKDFGFILEPGDDDSFLEQMNRDGIEINGIAYQINGAKGIAQARIVKKDMTDLVFENTIKLGDKTLAVTSINNLQGLRVINKDYNSVRIPANVETLGSQSFGGANTITIGRLVFEEGSHLKTIEDGAFGDVIINEPVVFPEGTESIRGLYMRDADITIPSTVTTLENLYFIGLKHVRVSWPTPLVVNNLFSEGQFTYGNNINDATLHVPVGTRELYANAEGWKNFLTIVEGNEDTGIDTIGANSLQTPDAVYSLDGRRVNTGNKLPHGIYIIKGKKIVK